ncbi:MAG TPA: hypothetical protein EYP68_06855 [Candidatus Korarchaeota archaeon]|nr:hypothetical protein [Candidatus Korarchaeota archaeon]
MSFYFLSIKMRERTSPGGLVERINLSEEEAEVPVRAREVVFTVAFPDKEGNAYSEVIQARGDQVKAEEIS